MQLTDTNSNTIDIKKYSNVTDDSRDVVKGGIFIAVRGYLFDGHDYISEALQRGAALIIIDKNRADLVNSISSTYVVVDDTRLALSYIVSKIYEKPENIVAVTGTNGKTSVVYFFQQLLFLLGIEGASIGTLGILGKNKPIFDIGGSLTSLGALQLHKMLQKIKDKKINYVALEASSHGLIQHRMDFVPLKGAAFTSFSREHLDYHETMDDYLKAKFYLFDQLLVRGSFALINSEMEPMESLVKICKSKGIESLTYGANGNFIKIGSIKYSNDNSFIVDFIFDRKRYQFICNFLGRFQIYNILCTLGILVSLGFDIEKLLPLLEKLTNVPGRMQRVLTSNVYVDYSHTPEALASALKSVSELMKQRKMNKGRVITIFGCGGERDKGKRFEMGKIANELSDIVIITDDNPRSEDASQIRREIMRGCSSALDIADREQAIKYAIQNSKSEDFVLISGKGHEKVQIIAGKKIEFDDVKVVKKYLCRI